MDWTKLGERELAPLGDVLRTRQPKKLQDPDKLERGDCKALAEWQLSHNPTCTLIHEASSGFQTPYDLSDGDVMHNTSSREQIQYINEGAFRQVWMIRDYDGTKRVMKTLLASRRKNFDKRNHDRHRRDAISFAQAQSSPLIVNLYGYCDNSALFDYADGGDLYDVFSNQSRVTRLELLQLAYNITLSVHHAHNFDSEGRATIAHTDIKPDQWLFQDGYYRLSDFNRVRFLAWNYEEDRQCGFSVGKNGGNFRSPEEYAYKIETEKVDEYSMGNVLYFLLTQEEPWGDVKSHHVYTLVQDGQRPKIPDKIYHSNRTYERYMIRAIEMAWTHEAERRPGALELSEVLKEGIEKLSEGTNDSDYRS
jgi:serine/threonine protein kinase